MIKKIRGYLHYIPFLPLSAVLFIITVIILNYFKLVPSPKEILLLLELVYKKFGLLGVFIASFLEGLVYLGLYFPGSMIIVLSLLVSGGGLLELFKIAAVVGLAFTFTSTINYIFGRALVKKKSPEKTNPKLLFLSMLHPHFISFYFFNEGLQKTKPFKIIIVPLFITFYIFLLATFLYPLGRLATNAIGDPFALIGLMMIWFTFALILKIRKEIKTQKEINNYLARILTS